MTTDRVAMFIYPIGGLIATRDKLTVVRGRTGLEIMKNMYQAAPDVKVVYFFTTASDSEHYKPTMDELKKVGYGNIKMVNAASWMSTEYFSRSSIKMSVGESFAYVTISKGEPKPSEYQVYERTSNGYVLVGDEKVCEIKQFQKCPKLKNICIPMTDGDFPESEKTRMQSMFPGQTVHFVRSKGRNWLKCMWDEYDGNVKNFLPAPFTMKVHFKYGNAVHVEKVEYHDQGPTNAFKLNIDDARKLDIDVQYDRLQIEHLKSYKFGAGKSRVLKVTLKVGSEFCPEVAVVIESEADTVESVVYSIDFNQDKQRFTGRLITAKDKLQDISNNSHDISDVFNQLNLKKGSAKLRGVLIDYCNHTQFPIDIHRSIVNALPSKDTPICVGQTHSYFAVHLRNSGVQLSVGEHGLIFTWPTSKNEHTEYYIFEKTKKGFKMISRHDEIPYHLPISALVVVVYEKGNASGWMVMKNVFPFAKIAVSECVKLSRTAGFNFAWQYFNGLNFDGYMTEPYRGVMFAAEHDGCSEYIDLFCDPNYGKTKCSMACTLDKSKSSKFSVSMFGIGFPKGCTVMEVSKPDADFGFLTFCMDESLIPTLTVTGSNTPLLSAEKAVGKMEPVSIDQASNSTPASFAPVDTVGDDDDVDDEDLDDLFDELDYATFFRFRTCDFETALNMAGITRNVPTVPDTSKVQVPTVNQQPSDSNVTSLDLLKHTQVDAVLEKSVTTTKTTTSDVSIAPPPTVILTFTSCNQVLIAAGPDYTGHTQFPAYLRLKHKNGHHKFVIGEKAKAALKKHRESVIYDVPGLLAANLNSDHENATWTFATSRADDGSLLIHLNDKDKTSPVVVFGHILRAALQHVSDHLPTKLEHVGIRLHNEASISSDDLSAISLKLGVDLVLL